MMKILVTGATGNIGQAVIDYLLSNRGVEVFAGVRDISRSKKQFPNTENLNFVAFDFEAETTHCPALNGMDMVFLLRPPHLSDVDKYFRPLIERIKDNGIRRIVFLSVQGVETSSVIPHHKIEKIIVESGLEYIFVRPSYFMQNLSTTFLKEIKNDQSVTVPAKNGVFNWIDVKNIGEATAQLIFNFENYKNKGYDITGNENKTFSEACSELSSVLGKPITFKSPSIFIFFRMKQKEGLPNGLIMVIILLHFLPRFQKPPKIAANYKQLTGQEPTTLKQFFEREKESFL